jgi:hypothetical protein
MPDLYEILGVTSEASIDDIKQGFRQKALECHPDISESSTSNREFRKLVEAYEVPELVLQHPLFASGLALWHMTGLQFWTRYSGTRKNGRNMTGYAKELARSPFRILGEEVGGDPAMRTWMSFTSNGWRVMGKIMLFVLQDWLKASDILHF